MTFEDSPSLEDFSEGMPEQLPDPYAKRKRVWAAIGGMFIVTMVLIVLNVLQSGAAAVPGRTGTVSGIVVSHSGKPLDAFIFVIGTDIEGRTDDTGYFEVSGVPVRTQSIVVTYQGMGKEFPVTLTSGSNTYLGEITLDATEEPGS